MADRADVETLRRGLWWLVGLLALPGLAAGGGQEPTRVEWLRDHAVPMSALGEGSISRALEEALSGVRVVMLGEATRGDGSSFLAKTRWIRFLHEEMGFDLLVFECGVYDCSRAWREIRSGADVDAALRAALFAFYREAAQLEPLVQLIAESSMTDRPLEVAGFDSLLTGRHGAVNLSQDLRRLASRLALGSGEADGVEKLGQLTLDLARDAYATGELTVPSRRQRRRVGETFGALRRHLAEAPEDVDPDFWRQVLASLEVSAKQAWQSGVYRPGAPIDPRIQNLRSEQMAENLLWLVEQRQPHRKAIVWSTSIHLARNLGRLTTGDAELRRKLGELSMMGERVASKLGDEVYTVAFTASGGRKGTVFGRPVALLEPTRGSFEELMRRTGLEAAFVDLRHMPQRSGGRWLGGAMIARPLSFVELQGVWRQHVDGFVYLRTMEPVVRIER